MEAYSEYWAATMIGSLLAILFGTGVMFIPEMALTLSHDRFNGSTLLSRLPHGSDRVHKGTMKIGEKGSGEEEIRKLVQGAIAHLQKDAGGVRPGPKDMEIAVQVAQQWIRAAGLLADGKLVSEIVEAELAK